MEEITPGTEGSRGPIIRHLRDSIGMTSDELGRRIGLSGQLVRSVETGATRASNKFCIDVARVFEVPVSRIVGDDIAAIIARDPAQAAS